LDPELEKEKREKELNQFSKTTKFQKKKNRGTACATTNGGEHKETGRQTVRGRSRSDETITDSK